MDIDQEYIQHLSPIQKLISNQRLCYLPNLYYQLYRGIEKLSLLRYQFPEQKILLERKPTKHDQLIAQIKEKQFIRKEIMKYRKAICYQLAKAAKDEIIKKNLKRQEKYLFHRVAYSQLAESVARKIQQQSQSNPQLLNDAKKLAVHAINIKHEKHSKKGDDIFIDRSQSQVGQIQQNDLFDDILNQPLNINEDIPPQQDNSQIQNINAYIIKLESYNQRATLEDQKFINRKQCMKKINQNLRKRIKNKTSDDTQERNLSSATVLITNLIGLQSQQKTAEGFIDIPSHTQYLFNIEGRSKKRKQEGFELKWSNEELSKFIEMNPKFDIAKGKFSPSYLLLSMQKKQYESIFDKNIQSKMAFPPSLASIPDLSKKFRQKYYYNSMIDPEYEKFIMKHNKRDVFERFKTVSKYVLQNSYQHDIEGNNQINMAKMFLTAEGPCSDRVIYKVSSNGILSAASLPQKSQLTKAQLSELTFLVRKYMGVFGSNWKLITLFLSTQPTFANMFLSPDQIQELSQICKDNNICPRTGLSSIYPESLEDRKVLPHSIYGGSASYTIFNNNMKLKAIEEPIASNQNMIDIQNTHKKEDSDTQINLNDYDSLINQPLVTHENNSTYIFTNTAKQYDRFCQNVRFPGGIDYDDDIRYSLTENIEKVLEQLQAPKSIVRLSETEQQDSEKISWAFQMVLQKLKGEIKIAYPLRKRKNINDKSSELVKILHTLKQKLISQSQIPNQPRVNPPSALSAKPTPSATPSVTESQQIKKVLPKDPENKEKEKEKDKQVVTNKDKKDGKSSSSQKIIRKKKKDKDEDK